MPGGSHAARTAIRNDVFGSDSPAVRLGGVHALAGLADDAPDVSLRQTCIDVLCAYLRLPYTPDPGPADLEGHHRFLALREVRHTILRLIGDHYRRPEGTHRSWQGCDLDLTGITIDGHMDFGGAMFASGEVSFSGAAFTDGTVSFHGATFSGAEVFFGGATFASGSVSFQDATFSDGEVSFARATFSGGRVLFGRGTFAGAAVSFTQATFSGGRVFFGGAMFASGAVSFSGAAFTDGTVSFLGATFDGSEMLFHDATFAGGELSFRSARGAAPSDLLAAVGSPVPAAVTLPSAWAPTS
ncbi:pentapeptide repeat-containing protein [Streptomyces sp. t39]|uniref:pentapeptide repeat-containing protein n=1 Tax=Streptomyces sp. t39 TaxID=1828156 RepID=UPI0011CD65BE|nr:pentapeptide repeat-containing protein [Streptomyces sp. t39]TXS52748.1 pentapeptide repeat-containing protein [Streptomyces sp. t39]